LKLIWVRFCYCFGQQNEGKLDQKSVKIWSCSWKAVSSVFKIFDARFWSGLVGSASRGEDFRRGKRQPRASKNRAKSSDDGRQELGKSWARSGPASSTPHPASRGRRIRQGASHQPGPAPDARSDGRASEEANSWGPFGSFRGAWGLLGPSWARLGGS